MSNVKTISDHRERTNAAILASFGAKTQVIKELTKKKPLVNYRAKENSEDSVCKNITTYSKKSDPFDLMKAEIFIKIYSNLNARIGDNYSVSERFIKAYMTYIDCMGSVRPLNINSCYRVVKDVMRSHWCKEVCVSCTEDFYSITNERLCQSCLHIEQITCSRCHQVQDKIKEDKVRRGRKKTICSECKPPLEKITESI